MFYISARTTAHLGGNVELSFAWTETVSLEKIGSHAGLGQINLSQNLLAALQIAFAGLGQQHMPRCSVKQACMQSSLQFGDRTRHLGRTHRDERRGLCEAAGLNDSNEHPHVEYGLCHILSGKSDEAGDTRE